MCTPISTWLNSCANRVISPASLHAHCDADLVAGGMQVPAIVAAHGDTGDQRQDREGHEQPAADRSVGFNRHHQPR
jgi:hypothetical protein